MSTVVLRTFEVYQKARVQFVQTVAELSKRKENFEALQSAGALLLLKPLLLDNVPSVAQTACIAIGRMASESADIAESVIGLDILPQIVYSIAEQNRFFKKCAAYVLRAIAKHHAELAQAVVDADGLTALSKILTEFDPSVKEAGCWAISYIANLASAVIDAISVHKLVLCIQEPEIGLKRIAASALMQIARHSTELAKKVVFHEQTTVPFLSPLIFHSDTLLKRQVIACLSHIAYHNQELSQKVIEGVNIEKLISLLQDPDLMVRINTAECIKNIVKHTAEHAKFICNKDGPRYLIEYLQENHGMAREPALWALSYIAGFDESLALGIIASKGIPAIKEALIRETDPNIQMRATYALGCLGKHSSDHAKALAENDVLNNLMQILINPNSIEELKKECRRALKMIIQNCTSVQALDKIITDETPGNILVHVFKQLAKVLPMDTNAKKQFVINKGLRKILDKKNKIASDPAIKKAIDDICTIYPDEMVKYYTPDYRDILLKKLEEYHPNEV